MRAGYRQRLRGLYSRLDTATRLSSNNAECQDSDEIDSGLHKRNATKYGDNVVCNVDNARQHAFPTELADGMAFGWSSMMQQPHAESQLVDDYIASIRPPRRIADLEKLDAQVSLDEVRATIKRCKRGKSCGPDGLGNMWYREHCDRIASILVKLLNDWLQTDVVPDSFGEANIQCIKKLKQPLTHWTIGQLTC
ncbi:uncharacterized protein PHALS_04208 [Plasmopara halstedii]|uniref:Reverse transcriptase n=1 Tax=Plasmopara halstedii TaxID=4781 RepID=A0A0P1A8F4_PLAHL|nr:uncharacterized protein PHALS_04208 [Plasmopara halstedii]CEG36959.1 hypothetical protein PHALS_04208 [Plasmopara halstedii]|eukprot:XP_024573328.1 hypothetical protein PHALS_04208 [Plasmopara halstedii]